MTNNFQLLVIVGGALVGSAFILFILSNSLTAWSKTNNDDGEITFGLWRQCNTTNIETVCEDLLCPSKNFNSAFCSKILAARAFLTLSCIFSGISAALSIIYCARSDDERSRRLPLTMKGLAFASLFMGIVGVPLGISATITIKSDTELRLDDAAIIGIAAIGVNLIGAITTALVKPYL